MIRLLNRIGNVYLLFVLTLAFFVWMNYMFFKRLNAGFSYSDATVHAYEVKARLNDIETLLLQAETAQRGYILTQDSGFIEPYLHAKQQYPLFFSRLQALLANSDTQRVNTFMLKTAFDSRIRYLDQNLRFRMSQQHDTAFRFTIDRHAMEQFRRKVNEMLAHEDRLLLQKRQLKEHNERLTPKTYLVVFGVSLLFLCIIFSFLIKELRQRTSYQKELEEKILHLNINNAELEQYAYVASHDLQEPLRKIQLFSSRLLLHEQHKLSENSRLVIDRIQAAAARTQELLDGLLQFTQLIQLNLHLVPVNLSRCAATVVKKLEDEIALQDAIVHVGKLPAVMGNPQQIELLFEQLLENALKFRLPDRRPEVNIRLEANVFLNSSVNAHGKTQYYKVSIKDNGLGFSNAYKDKLFKVFQKLHSNTTESGQMGLGLAMCRRIMANHNGYIDADGALNRGAVFYLYFPVQ
jgi:signal transduction histidine kinase